MHHSKPALLLNLSGLSELVMGIHDTAAEHEMLTKKGGQNWARFKATQLLSTYNHLDSDSWNPQGMAPVYCKQASVS